MIDARRQIEFLYEYIFIDLDSSGQEWTHPQRKKRIFSGCVNYWWAKEVMR